MGYIKQAIEALRALDQTTIEKAAQMVAEAIENGRSIYSFGASHSFILTEEMVYRTGGLMLVNPIYPHGMNLFIRPITLTSMLERVDGLGAELLGSVPAVAGDVLILTSTSGRNAVAIDMAIAARERGMKVIGITSLDYTNGVTSRHPSGKKVLDFCDLVIDNAAPYGDACVSIEGFPQKVGPLSTVTGCAIVNAMVCEVVSLLMQRGIEPPVYMSANLDGGDAYNDRLMAENKERIHYM
jgi:uncharacterized phosphosugar-binding protein